MDKNNGEVSTDTKTIITVLLLLLVYPIGVIVMYRWTNWSNGVKNLIALPLWLIILAIVLVMVGGFASVFSPSSQIDKVKQEQVVRLNETDMKMRAGTILNEVARYNAQKSRYPWAGKLGYVSGDLLKEAWYQKMVKDNPKLGEIGAGFILKQTPEGVQVCYESEVSKGQVCVK